MFVRNEEAGGSSPLTSTRNALVHQAGWDVYVDRRQHCAVHRVWCERSRVRAIADRLGFSTLADGG